MPGHPWMARAIHGWPRSTVGPEHMVWVNAVEPAHPEVLTADQYDLGAILFLRLKVSWLAMALGGLYFLHEIRRVGAAERKKKFLSTHTDALLSAHTIVLPRMDTFRVLFSRGKAVSVALDSQLKSSYTFVRPWGRKVSSEGNPPPFTPRRDAALSSTSP